MRASKASARRATLAVWEDQVERLKQEAPQAPAGADKQAMSGDGAMVHLVGGEWDARQDACTWGGDAQSAGGSLHTAPLVLLMPG